MTASQFSSTVTNSITEQGIPQKTPFLTAHSCSALEEQDWEIPTYAQSTSCNAVMLRAPSTDPHTASTAEGRQLAGFTACKAMTVAVWALKELKLL